MTSLRDGVAALQEGRARVDLSSWWKLGVHGADAEGWLNDLLSAELSGIAAGEARRSLLLTPTGRIRAAATVTRFEDGYLLLQDATQPKPIEQLLDPYVLSSDVRLTDRTDDLSLFAFPGPGGPPDVAVSDGASTFSPSVLGPGTDVVGPTGSEPTLPGAVASVGLEDVETWRVLRGVARFGVDLSTDSLPQEADTGQLIAYGKGCFLGQEAVARVRNLGHPPFVLLAADAPATVAPGETLMAEDREAGAVTSSTDSGTGAALIARVRWALKDAALSTTSGVELVPRGLASAA
jgi:folate-binding protein YgfZ